MSPRRTPVFFAAHLAFAIAFLLLALLWLVFSQPLVYAQSQPEALGTVSGRVTDAEGEPLPDIVVSLEDYVNSYGGPAFQTSSDAVGNYHFAAVYPGIYRVKFSDPSGRHADIYYVSSSTPQDATRVVVNGDDVEKINVRMASAGTIVVTLLNTNTVNSSAPEVLLYRQTNIGEWQSFRTLPATGLTTERLGGLPYGVYKLCTKQTSHSTSLTLLLCHEDWIAGSSLDRPGYLPVPAGATDISLESKEPVSITLDFFASSQLRGIVLAPDGSPLPNILVEASGSSGTTSRTTTDALGQFHFSYLPEGKYRILANGQDYYSGHSRATPYVHIYYPNTLKYEEAKELAISHTSRMSVTLKLVEEGRISGKVSLPGGVPLTNPAVIIYMRLTDGNWAGSICFETCPEYAYDLETGAYTVTRLAPGSYRLSAHEYIESVGTNIMSFYRGADLDSAGDIEVASGKTTSNINVRLSNSHFSGGITGTVTANGEPQAGIEVRLHTNLYVDSIDIPYLITTTGAEGAYQFEGLPTAGYRISVYDPQGRYLSAYYQDEDGNQGIKIESPWFKPDVNIALQPGGTIRGRIRSSEAMSRENYRILVHQPIGDGGFLLLSLYDIHSDAGGSYAITGLPSGDYIVSARPPDALPNDFSRDHYYPGTPALWEAMTVTVAAGEVVEGINIAFGNPPDVRMPYVSSGQTTPD